VARDFLDGSAGPERGGSGRGNGRRWQDERLGHDQEAFRHHPRPGKIPDLKKPLENSHDGAIRLLREAREYYPDARFTLVELTWNDEFWVSDGHEALTIHDALAVDDEQEQPSLR